MELAPALASPRAASPARAQRVDGAARVAFARAGLADLDQRAPCRFLFPTPAAGDPPQAIAITTSGGLTGGDRIRFALDVAEGAAATVATQAAEKLYRALPDDADTRISTDIRVAAGAWGEWLAQEAILFDGARVRRTLAADVHPTARLLVVESLVFGRGAMGETMRTGRIHDQWRIRRGGRLVWADALRLEGDIAAAMAAPFAFGDARACATILYVGADAAHHLDLARTLIRDARGGATSFDALLIVRLLDADPAAMRRAVVRVAGGLRAAAGFGAAMPAVWTC